VAQRLPEMIAVQMWMCASKARFFFVVQVPWIDRSYVSWEDALLYGCRCFSKIIRCKWK
jgi:hypothetical protein